MGDRRAAPPSKEVPLSHLCPCRRSWLRGSNLEGHALPRPLFCISPLIQSWAWQAKLYPHSDIHQGSKGCPMGKQSTAKADNTVPSFEDLERGDAIRRAGARTDAQRRAAQARKVKALYEQSHAQYYMTFGEFRSQSKRNRILKGYGLDPVFLPHEGCPSKPRKLQ